MPNHFHMMKAKSCAHSQIHSMVDTNKFAFLSDAKYMNKDCLPVKNTCISLLFSFHPPLTSAISLCERSNINGLSFLMIKPSSSPDSGSSPGRGLWEGPQWRLLDYSHGVSLWRFAHRPLGYKCPISEEVLGCACSGLSCLATFFPAPDIAAPL